MKLKNNRIVFMAYKHKKRRIRKKYSNILLKFLKNYTIKLYMSDFIETTQFYGTEEEMKQFVNTEARAYCVRGVEVMYGGVKCYTAVNCGYNFDKAENSDDGYLDFCDIFPQFKKEIDSL